MRCHCTERALLDVLVLFWVVPLGANVSPPAPSTRAAVGSVRLACPACDSDGRLSCPILMVIFKCPMETSLASTKSVESTEIATTADHVVFVIAMALDQLAAHLPTNPVERLRAPAHPGLGLS